MGNTESGESGREDVPAPFSQASSSTSPSKRARMEENKDDDSKKDPKSLKTNEHDNFNKDVVPENLDSSVEEESSCPTMKKASPFSKELVNLTNVISSHLTCSNCESLPRARPLMMCSSGHVTCSPCYHLSRSLLQCPRPGCQHHVTEHPAPELAQDLLSTITRSCSWAHHGCRYSGALADLETHEPGCVFQEVECWVCGSSPSLANFHNHSPDLGCYQGATIHNAVRGNITMAMSVASGPSGNPFILGSFLVEIGQKLGKN